MNEPVANLIRRAAEIQEAGGRVLGCLLVDARGSTPQAAGSLMLVDEAANLYGTIGGGCVEAEVRQRAVAMLGRGESGQLTFKLDHDYGWDDGLICGGTIELAVAPMPEPDTLRRIVADLEGRRPTALTLHGHTLSLPPRERLYVAGAGHVGQAVARLAVPLEFDVTLLDDRADLLRKYAPEGVATQSGDIAASLEAAPFDDRTYCVIVTRGHRHDEKVLAVVAERGAAYVGMIGSRRKVKLVVDDLVERGVSEAALDAVHAPIGLDIGAVTVEEIALSIAAQLVEVRRRVAAPAVART